MLAKAFDKAKSTEAKAVAYALEGMQYQTPYGMVTMRAEDHQLIQPLYLSIMTKVGTQGVKYDVENTGEGWKTIARIEAANYSHADHLQNEKTCQIIRRYKVQGLRCKV